MKIDNCLQGSTEWLNLRAGIPTSSCFDMILTKTGNPSKSAERYLFDLLAERVMQRPLDEYISTWMQRGNELEEDAVRFYELSRDCETLPVGFVMNDEGTIGASPDRLVGDDGLLEIKVPSPHVHMGYLLKAGSAYEAYRCQVQGQLWITGRKWSDLLAWNPELPPAIHRTERDEEFIALLAEAVGKFSLLLEDYSRQLVERGWIKAWPIPQEIREGPAPQSGEGFISQEDLEYAQSLEQQDTHHKGKSAPVAPSNSASPAVSQPFAPAGHFTEAEGVKGVGVRAEEGWGALGGAPHDVSGMIAPDYSKDPSPPCPKCGGPTVFKLSGKFKSTRWNDGWKCDRKPSNCKKEGVKGAWIDAAEWHNTIGELKGSAKSAEPTGIAEAGAGESQSPPQPRPPGEEIDPRTTVEGYRAAIIKLMKLNESAVLTVLRRHDFSSLDDMPETELGRLMLIEEIEREFGK